MGEEWKIVLDCVTILPPVDNFQVLNSQLWWNHVIQGIGHGFSRNKTTQLDRNGFRCIKDVWDFENNRLHTANVIRCRFKLD